MGNKYLNIYIYSTQIISNILVYKPILIKNKRKNKKKGGEISKLEIK